MQIKRQLINAIFIPTLCYQCQTWTLTKELERKLSSCEMRVLRKAANKTMRDRIQNEEIRKTVGTTPVIEYIEKQSQLVWSFNENESKLASIKSVQYEIRNNKRKRKTKKKMD
jgi:hypothetical protein